MTNFVWLLVCGLQFVIGMMVGRWFEDRSIASVELEGKSAIRSAIEDVATPFGSFTGKTEATDCTDLGPDNFPDFTLKFKTQDIVDALGAVQDGDVRVLTLTGTLTDGTPIQGEDVVVILKKGKN